ncbi:MAG: fibronectin type III domain-containing protein [Chthoniobacteraceae bacterium]
MAQVKLELDRRSDDDLHQFTETHIAAMDGNANFPTPAPTTAAFQTVFDDYRAKLTAAKKAAMEAEAATALKETARATLSLAWNDRGNYLQSASGGDAAKIMSAAVGVRDEPQPIGPLPAPEDFMPTMGDAPGEIDLTWSRVRGARTYIVEYRESGTTGAWSQTFATKSRASVTGLTGGKTYTFRVAAVGAAGQSPWSLEAARMAP